MGKKFIVMLQELKDDSYFDLENENNIIKGVAGTEKIEEKKLIQEKTKKDRQRGKGRKRRKRREKGEYRTFLWIVLGAFLLIIASMIYVNYKICFLTVDPSISEVLSIEKKAESTLLTTGLTIIGIAISVWAGLNIVQVLEKGKLEELGKEVALYRKERCELNRRNFFNNLLKLDDTLNKHLYKVFSEMDDEDDNLAKFYFDCNRIEHKFQNIYLKQRKIERNLPKQYYIETIDDTNRLLNIVVNSDYVNAEVFIKYLKIRLAEIYFYLGYIVPADESIRCFQLVIDYFCEVFEDLKYPQKIMQNRAYLYGNKNLTIYMFNTLGEANSMIIYAYLLEKKSGNIDNYPVVAQNVKLLYESVIKLVEDNKDKNKTKREVFYRNYGCALERINEFENGKFSFNNKEEFEKIKEQYQKAIDEVLFNDRESVREQTFYTYLSLYYKYIKSCNIIDIFSKLEKEEKTENIEQYKNYTQDAYYYVKMALTLEPLSIYYWKIKAFVERDLVLWALIDGNDEKAQCHYNHFIDWYENIERIEKRKEEDDMRKELGISYSYLQKLMQKNKSKNEQL